MVMKDRKVLTDLPLEIPDEDESLGQDHQAVDEEDEVEGMHDETVDVVANQKDVNDHNDDQPDKPVLGEEATDSLHTEVKAADVGDDQAGVKEGVAENRSRENEIGVVEVENLVLAGNVEIMRTEDNDKHVDTEEDDDKFAEDVDVKDLNVEVANGALS